MSRAAAKRGGETAESIVIQLIDELEHVTDSDDEHVDARASSVIVPSQELPAVGIAVVAIDTLCEIKSVMVVYGENGNRGRFYLRKKQHQHLLEEGAVYIFTVCRPIPSRDVIAAKIIPSTIVDELVSSWIDGGDRPDYAQLTWSRIFDPSEISRNVGDSV